MSRRKVFTTWEECRIWMCGAIGKRWVKDKHDDVYKGRDESGYGDMPLNPSYAPWTAIRDEHGDIPEDEPLPELDAELVKECDFEPTAGPNLAKDVAANFKRIAQLTIAQAVRLATQKREGK